MYSFLKDLNGYVPLIDIYFAPSPVPSIIDIYLVIRAIRCVTTSRDEWWTTARISATTRRFLQPTIDPCRDLKKKRRDVHAIARRVSVAILS